MKKGFNSAERIFANLLIEKNSNWKTFINLPPEIWNNIYSHFSVRDSPQILKIHPKLTKILNLQKFEKKYLGLKWIGFYKSKTKNIILPSTVQQMFTLENKLYLVLYKNHTFQIEPPIENLDVYDETWNLEIQHIDLIRQHTVALLKLDGSLTFLYLHDKEVRKLPQKYQAYDLNLNTLTNKNFTSYVLFDIDFQEINIYKRIWDEKQNLKETQTFYVHDKSIVKENENIFIFSEKKKIEISKFLESITSVITPRR